VYPAAVVATSTATAEARRFLAYLRTEPAKAAFQRSGFTPTP
jgi:ABC-type molybdate transport system substrate-binding protein